MLRRRWVSLVAAIAAVVLLAGGIVVGEQADPQAASANPRQFNPGHIISDDNFYNGNAMTEAQVQAFLVANGSGLASYRSSVASRATRVDSADSSYLYCNAFTGGQNLLASTIIYRAQVACGISARVLLVTLQKEQGLITNPNQPAGALRIAMGYGCPDTAPCNELYYGFGNQIYMAALQFKFYKRPQNGFNFQPGVRYVQYHPTASCGGTNVTIQNWATAGLYNYTPYQPTAASLGAFPGPAPGEHAACGSYGNRNFFFFYLNWFGSPLAPSAPFGAVDTVSPSAEKVRVAGWTFTSGKTTPISAHVYVDGQFVQSVNANLPRSDVASRYPFQGPAHGFDVTIAMTPGTRNVCVHGLDPLSGGNALLACRTVVVPAAEPASTELGAVYRFWSDTYNGHFYTRSVNERNKLIQQYPDHVWRYEAVSYGAYGAPVEGTVPVYRFWSATYNGHFYTTSAAERDKVIAQYPASIWQYENVAFYVYPATSTAGDLKSVERFWSPSYLHHFYTADASEAQKVRENYPPHIWTYENTAFKVPVASPAGAPLP